MTAEDQQATNRIRKLMRDLSTKHKLNPSFANVVEKITVTNGRINPVSLTPFDVMIQGQNDVDALDAFNADLKTELMKLGENV
jgi:hypothetical protein